MTSIGDCEISRLRLEPGDVLVATTSKPVPRQVRDQLEQTFRRVADGHKVLVLDPSIALSVLSPTAPVDFIGADLSRLRTLGPRVATLDTRKAKPLEKVADPHYKTPEHEAWALQVKRRAGWRCEHVENGQRCEKSAHRGDRMYADHIKNIRDFPELALDLDNGRCACNSHNTRAGIQDRANRMKS